MPPGRSCDEEGRTAEGIRGARITEKRGEGKKKKENDESFSFLFDR